MVTFPPGAICISELQGSTCITSMIRLKYVATATEATDVTGQFAQLLS
jgi:hypothetical protein